MQMPTTKTVAVIGASADRRKFGNKGMRAFQAAGWRVIPVNPNEPAVEGLPTVASVADIAGPLDVVSLYVPPAVGLKLLPAIAAKMPGELWINPGAESRELLAEAARLGLKAVPTCSIIAVGFTPSDFGGGTVCSPLWSRHSVAVRASAGSPAHGNGVPSPQPEDFR